MKKSVNINFNLSNRTTYTLITFLILAVIGVGVYAVAGTTPNPGHAFTELQPCNGVGEILKSDGTTWTCGVDDSGSGSISWDDITNIPGGFLDGIDNEGVWDKAGTNDIYYGEAYNPSGNVGIGTDQPLSALTIHKGGTGPVGVEDALLSVIGGASGWGIYATAPLAIYGRGGTGVQGEGTSHGIVGISYEASGTGGLFVNTRSSVVLTIRDSSNTCDFGVNGNGWASISCTSDARLKKNIQPLTDKDIKRIVDWTLFYANNMRKYQWKSDNETGYSNIAQELQLTYPNKVNNITDGNETYLAVTSPDNKDILITIVQQQAQIEDLKQRISELEN